MQAECSCKKIAADNGEKSPTASYLLGVYEKSMPESYTLRQKLAVAKKAGFDFMEISVDESDKRLARLDWSEQQRHDLIKDMWAEEIHICSMCLSGHRKYPLGSEDDTVSALSLEIMQKAVLLASDLGIRVIQLAGYDEYYHESNEATRKRFAENLKKCVEMAACCGVILAFETMETAFMDTVEKAQSYVNLVQSPFLKIYPDIGNVTNACLLYGQDVVGDLEKGKGSIVMAHFKETAPQVYRNLFYGEGHVNFKQCSAVLREQGVRMFVGELWYREGQDPTEYLKGANNFLRSLF